MLNVHWGNKVRHIPDSDHDAITQLWSAIIGTNGEGMATRFEKIEKIIPHLMTSQQCRGIQDRHGKKWERSVKWIKDIALLALTALAIYKGAS